MNITISRQKITRIFWAIALMSLVSAGGHIAWRTKLLDRIWPEQKIQGTEAVLSAVSAFYAPDLDSGYEPWLAQVCAGMSEDGCGLLRKLYGEVVWKAYKGSGVKFVQSSTILLEDVEPLTNDHHIWKLGVTIVTINQQGEQASSQLQPYIQVSFDKEKAIWLLERILFDQEIQERYGNELSVTP